MQEDYIILRIVSKKYGIFDFSFDKEDYDKVRKYQWSVHLAGRQQHKKYYYATTQDTKPKTMLHRLIMNCVYDDAMNVDHIDGDTLNTRKSNLRAISHQKNCSNRALNFNNTSGVRGVTWSKKDNKWMVYIMINYKQKTLGYFNNLDDAAECRRRADVKYYGEADTMNH